MARSIIFSRGQKVAASVLNAALDEAVALGTAGVVVVPGYNRVSKAKMPRFRQALANARAGVDAGNSRILCLGDSTSRGRNSTITANQQYRAAYPHVLAGLMTAKTGVKFGRDCWMGEGNMAPQDERLVVTGGFAPSGGGLGGFCYLATAEASIVFTPAGAWNAAEIYWGRATTNGFSTTIGGSAPATSVDTGPAATGAQIRTITSGGAAAVQSLALAWTAGTLRIMGMRCFDTAVPEITVFNAGISGGQASNSIGTNATTGPEVWMDVLAPCLTIMDFGINEYRNGVSLAAYQANMETIINRLRPYCDVVIKTPMPDNQAPAAPANVPQQAYVDVARNLAALYDLPVVDVFDTWGSYALGNALGYYYDNVHGTARGYAEVAGMAGTALAAVA